MVDEAAHLRPKLQEEQLLADLVEDAAAIGKSKLGAMSRQQTVAEAVEVVNPQAGGLLQADGALETMAQLGRRPDVVCQHKDVFGGQAGVPLEEVPDALDDDRRLTRPGPGQDHERPVAPFDRAALFFGKPVPAGHGRPFLVSLHCRSPAEFVDFIVVPGAELPYGPRVRSWHLALTELPAAAHESRLVAALPFVGVCPETTKPRGDI